jgi:hypothetical protein
MANESIKGLFITCLEKGMSAAKEIASPTDKAMAYAELSKALALTGMVRENVIPIDNIEPKITAGKDAIKNAVTKAEKETVKPETKTPVKEAPAEEAVGESSYDWTEALQTEKSEQLDIVTQFMETFGEDFLLKAAAKVDSTVVSMDDIRPNNVDAIAAYLLKEGELIAALEGCDENDINNLIAQFSDGVLKSFDEIRPENIEPFGLYVETLKSQAGE